VQNFADHLGLPPSARQAKSSQVHYTRMQTETYRSVLSVQVVHADLEAAKLQISTLKAQLIMSHEAADSARAASDSLAQQMKKSADTELSRVVHQVDTAKAKVRHLQGLLANTQADAKSEAAKLRLVLEKSQANAASAQQDVKRLEQQLAGSQTAAAQQEEELKKLHKAELKSEVQALCVSLPTLLMRLPPNTPPPPSPPTCVIAPTLLHTQMCLATEPIVLGSPAQVWM